MPRTSARCLWLLVFTLAAAPLGAEERAVDYARDVKAVLKERCFACHGALKQEAGLRLDTAEFIRQGGDSGPAVTPGTAGESLLIERVSEPDASLRMPPEGQPLSAEQIAALRTWINAGALGVANEQPEADPRAHWAFRSPVRPPLPPVPSAEAADNPIDLFIAAERAARGWAPAPEVDKRLLLRRVSLDLIGLPPTRAEIEEFLADDSPEAYDKVVDRLLGSVHYGERWGRHWMDVWRYSDWYGLGQQLRNSQKHLWHWRDWIVESLNEDKGYDRMLVEMLAADEIAPLDKQVLRATGFLARNYYLFNRTTWLDDTLEHTSQAFLGLTMNCCKCHDHKYDPLTQLDYYRLRAIFEPHQVRLDALPGQPDLERDGLPRVFDAHPDAATYLHIRGDAKSPDKSRTIPPGVPELLANDDFLIEEIALPPAAFNPAVQPYVLDDQLRVANEQIAAAKNAQRTAREQLQAAREAAAALPVEAPLPAAADSPGEPAKPQDTETSSAAETLAALEKAELAAIIADRALAVAELKVPMLRAAHAADVAQAEKEPPAEFQQLAAAAALAARKYELAQADDKLARAQLKLATATESTRQSGEKELAAAKAAREKAAAALEHPGEKYTPVYGSLKALEGPDETEASRRQPYPRISTGRRTALARWIASPRNPLTARVAVNHLWLRHFGQPLVDPVNDFGRRTPQPIQYKLLDWLAVEFMENGWSMKHMHRLMVTSRTYRLSTSVLHIDEEARQADPHNHYYCRRLPVRMESQVVRDSLLQLAGVLNPALGGPTIDPGQNETHHRRSLYFTHSRDVEHKFLSMFDNADILRCYRRSESIIPQQALTLFNSRLALSLSRQIAEKLQSDLGECDDDTFIRESFRLILAVEPDGDELAACRELLAETVSLPLPNAVQAATRARQNLVHALLNHNDFVTIR